MELSSFKYIQAQEVIELFGDVFTISEGKSEGAVIKDLVSNLIRTTDDDDLLGFTACLEGKIIGAIFFSRLTFSGDQTAFILSPAAVASHQQGKGIGQKLINFGLAFLKSKEVDLVFTYGDPNFYSKVGFNAISENIIKAPFKLSQPEGWLAQSLKGSALEAIDGSVHCVQALDNAEYW